MSKKELKREVISCLVQNQTGVLARIISVFGRRGFNIETMTASPTNDPDITRITIILTATEETMEQVLAQVEKVETVKEVFPLGENTLYRELLLLKAKANQEERHKIKEIVDIYRGKIIDLSQDSVIVELTGSPNKIDAFIDVMNDSHTIIEVCRTGATGIEATGRTLSAV